MSNSPTTLLVDAIQSCDKCSGICQAIFPHGKEVGVQYVSLETPIQIMFVAESPPGSTDNFFYNPSASDTRFRNRLFKLMLESGIGDVRTVAEFTQQGFYLADAINCRWNKEQDSNKKVLFKQPTSSQQKVIISNCSPYLVDQIQLLKPKAIVFMGKFAETASRLSTVKAAMSSVGITDLNIVRMPFILTAPVSTEILVNSLQKLCNVA